MIIIPIFSAILSSFEYITYKNFLNKFKKLGPGQVVTSDFLAIVLILTIGLPFFYQDISIFVETRFLLAFVALIVIGVLGNLCFTKALMHEEVVTLEPFRIFSPFVTIIFALLFFRENVTLYNVGLLSLATIALLFSQKSFNFIKINKGIKFILLSITLFSIEPFFSKQVLNYLNPFFLYYIRAIFIFIILYILFKPRIIAFQKDKARYIFAVNMLSSVKYILIYFGLIHLGVLNTMVILMVEKPLNFILARIYLKEKLTWRNLISSTVILTCVIIQIIVLK